MAAGQEGGPPAQPWFDGWLGGALPFSFRYDGRDFAGAGDAWQFHRGQLHREANVESQDWTWLHPKTRPEGDLARQAVPRLPGRGYAC